MIGKKVIVRFKDAGVYFGTLVSKDEATGVVVLKDCQNIWYWSGANSVMQLATEGVKNPEKCKFTVVVKELEIRGYMQIIPATSNAEKSIKNTRIWNS